jgi:hypothetical protein
MNTKNNSIKIFILLILSLNLSSCDEVDELTRVDFNTTLNEDVTVTLSESNAGFDRSFTLNLNNNDDIEPYLDKIESINITSASYIIKDYSGLEAATGSLTVNSASELFGPFQHTFFEDDQNTAVFTLDDSGLNALANSLTSNNQLVIDVSGSQNPAQNASFTVEFRFQLEVTAQAL